MAPQVHLHLERVGVKLTKLVSKQTNSDIVQVRRITMRRSDRKYAASLAAFNVTGFLDTCLCEFSFAALGQVLLGGDAVRG